ncbi:hypothetical protein IAR55_005425 [Kwoniella newhampshirensis]|uniref:Ribosomal protein n=1 Tax=Kwoniella newhampshirensis TaxID=1651941 RepID=A0AAW0YIG0_9TREE
MSSSSTLATMLRGGLRGYEGVRNGGGAVRLRRLHASSIALKKGRNSRESEDSFEADEYQEEKEEEDLFDAPSRSSSSFTPLDKSAIRQSNVSAILSFAKQAEQDRKLKLRPQKIKSKAASSWSSSSDDSSGKKRLPIQGLRQVVACSEGEDEIAELKKVVRAWKVAGMKVTKRTGAEIVGRCCNLGRPEVAAELVSNREQYGLPDLDQPIMIKLHHALLTSSRLPPRLPATQPISPTLTLLRLSLLQQKSADASALEQETARLLSSKKSRTFKSTEAIESWTVEAKSALKTAGGQWEEVLKKVVV